METCRYVHIIPGYTSICGAPAWKMRLNMFENGHEHRQPLCEMHHLHTKIREQKHPTFSYSVKGELEWDIKTHTYQ